MKYTRVASYVSAELWALHPAKLAELIAVVAFRAAGKEFTDAEIAARIGPRAAATSSATARGSVAVIPIRGVIAHRISGMEDTSGGTSCERIGSLIDQVAADPSIGTIVYDCDSPGGTVTGIQELAAKMFALRGQKTQIAQLNGLAASAAYWLASQCDERVCMPSGLAGSIGVYTAHEDLSKALEQEGISVELISAGKYKVEGSPFGPLTPEARAVKQASVDAAYAQFTNDVARGLGVSAKDVRNGYGEGRALSAKDAKAAGLIDRIATMDETLGRLVGRTGASRVGMNTEARSPRHSLGSRSVLRDTSVEGRARRAYVDALMASAHGGRGPALTPLQARPAVGAGLRADVRVMTCNCSPDCPCQHDGVCGDNCPTCQPGCPCVACDCSPDCPCQHGGTCGDNCPTCQPACACVAPETATPMPGGAMDAALQTDGVARRQRLL